MVSLAVEIPVSTRNGRIIDIRYFGGAHAHLDASPYRSFKLAQWVGDRIARKAREYELHLGKRDHLYVYLVPEPPFGSVTRAPPLRSHPSCCQAIEARLDPTGLDERSETEREDLLADITLRALAVAADEAPAALVSIERVRAAFVARRRELEVLWYTHETERFRVRVMHHLTPLVQGTLTMLRPLNTYYAVLWFEDRTTGFCGSHKLLEFGNYDDLNRAIGSVKLVGEQLVVKPKRGYEHEASLTVPLSALVPAAAANVGPH